ncbi:MAG: sugar phosphate isomerase/epimerase [Chloroflexi bacterium]|nr:sugar phosphate isomerase/epimerase [Chloroflexota bacterium]
MLLGAMNHPQRDVCAEIAAFRAHGFDYIDLTLEPPCARAAIVDVAAVRQTLRDADLPAVGHTPWYLPIASAIEELRAAALREAIACFDVFARLGVERVNVHPDRRVPMHDWEVILRRNLESLGYLIDEASRRGLQLMLENIPGEFNRSADLRRILDALPELGFHLDVAHAHLLTPTNLTDDLLAACSHRLVHVHVSDNRGGEADLHLPLGAGLIDWRQIVNSLRRIGYDGTVTLEVFTSDRDYLLMSRDKFRRLWESA